MGDMPKKSKRSPDGSGDDHSYSCLVRDALVSVITDAEPIILYKEIDSTFGKRGLLRDYENIRRILEVRNKHNLLDLLDFMMRKKGSSTKDFINAAHVIIGVENQNFRRAALRANALPEYLRIFFRERYLEQWGIIEGIVTPSDYILPENMSFILSLHPSDFKKFKTRISDEMRVQFVDSLAIMHNYALSHGLDVFAHLLTVPSIGLDVFVDAVICYNYASELVGMNSARLGKYRAINERLPAEIKAMVSPHIAESTEEVEQSPLSAVDMSPTDSSSSVGIVEMVEHLASGANTDVLRAIGNDLPKKNFNVLRSEFITLASQNSALMPLVEVLLMPRVNKIGLMNSLIYLYSDLNSFDYRDSKSVQTLQKSLHRIPRDLYLILFTNYATEDQEKKRWLASYVSRGSDVTDAAKALFVSEFRRIMQLAAAAPLEVLCKELLDLRKSHAFNGYHFCHKMRQELGDICGGVGFEWVMEILVDRKNCKSVGQLINILMISLALSRREQINENKCRSLVQLASSIPDALLPLLCERNGVEPTRSALNLVLNRPRELMQEVRACAVDLGLSIEQSMRLSALFKAFYNYDPRFTMGAELSNTALRTSLRSICLEYKYEQVHNAIIDFKTQPRPLSLESFVDRIKESLQSMELSPV